MSDKQTAALAEQSEFHRQERQRKQAAILRLHAEGLSNKAIVKKAKASWATVTRTIREAK